MDKQVVTSGGVQLQYTNPVPGGVPGLVEGVSGAGSAAELPLLTDCSQHTQPIAGFRQPQFAFGGQILPVLDGEDVALSAADLSNASFQHQPQLGGATTYVSQLSFPAAAQQEQDVKYSMMIGGKKRPGIPVMDLDSKTGSNRDMALTLACDEGHEELVMFQLSRGEDIERRDKKGFTPLILAATAGHDKVVEILLNNGADIEAQSERTKDNALCLACSGGSYRVVEILLSRGANKEHRNVSDYTPLSLAASGGYTNIIKLLLAHGAEINSRTGSKLGISPLMLASMNGHTAAVKLLLDMGSEINAQTETTRKTALTLACFQGRHEVVSLLLDWKANVEHMATTGLTPLMEAARGGYTEIGRVLLDKGADVNASSVLSSGDTALTLSADKGHYSFVELLLSRGAQVDVRNKKGNSSLRLAANGGHLDVVQLLHSAGADIDFQVKKNISKPKHQKFCQELDIMSTDGDDEDEDTDTEDIAAHRNKKKKKRLPLLKIKVAKERRVESKKEEKEISFNFKRLDEKMELSAGLTESEECDSDDYCFGEEEPKHSDLIYVKSEENGRDSLQLIMPKQEEDKVSLTDSDESDWYSDDNYFMEAHKDTQILNFKFNDGDVDNIGTGIKDINHRDFRSLSSADIGHVITVNGLVAKVKCILPKLSKETGVNSKMMVANTCSFLHDHTLFSKKQILIQELRSDVPAGQTPRNILVYVQNETAKSLETGVQVSVTGVLRIAPSVVTPGLGVKRYIEVLSLKKAEYTKIPDKVCVQGQPFPRILQVDGLDDNDEPAAKEDVNSVNDDSKSAEGQGTENANDISDEEAKKKKDKPPKKKVNTNHTLEVVNVFYDTNENDTMARINVKFHNVPNNKTLEDTKYPILLRLSVVEFGDVKLAISRQIYGIALFIKNLDQYRRDLIADIQWTYEHQGDFENTTILNHKKPTIFKHGDIVYYSCGDLWRLTAPFKKVSDDEKRELPFLICYTGESITFYENEEEMIQILVDIITWMTEMQPDPRDNTWPVVFISRFLKNKFYPILVTDYKIPQPITMLTSGEGTKVGKTLMAAVVKLATTGQFIPSTGKFTAASTFKIVKHEGEDCIIEEFPDMSKKLKDEVLEITKLHYQRLERTVGTDTGCFNSSVTFQCNISKSEWNFSKADASKILWINAGNSGLKRLSKRKKGPKELQKLIDAAGLKLYKFYPALLSFSLDCNNCRITDEDMDKYEHIVGDDDRLGQELLCYEKFQTKLRSKAKEYGIELPSVLEEEADFTCMLGKETEDLISPNELVRHIIALEKMEEISFGKSDDREVIRIPVKYLKKSYQTSQIVEKCAKCYPSQNYQCKVVKIVPVELLDENLLKKIKIGSLSACALFCYEANEVEQNEIDAERELCNMTKNVRKMQIYEPVDDMLEDFEANFGVPGNNDGQKGLKKKLKTKGVLDSDTEDEAMEIDGGVNVGASGSQSERKGLGRKSKTNKRQLDGLGSDSSDSGTEAQPERKKKAPPKFGCDYCDKMFSTSRGAKMHTSIIHKKKSDENTAKNPKENTAKNPKENTAKKPIENIGEKPKENND